MRRLTRLGIIAWVVLVLVAYAFGQQDEPGGSDVKESAAPSSLALPHMQYQHTTFRGNRGVFRLEGETGEANYVFNGRRHHDKLAFVRTGTVGGVSGWAYQVKRGGNPVRLWFFFGSRPIATSGMQKFYPMYFSQMPDDATGRKLWTRIRTPTWTQGIPLGQGQGAPEAPNSR